VLVFDTNIWVSYAMSPKGKVGVLVQKALETDDYAFSKETMRELTEVLFRDKFDRYVSREMRLKYLKMLASGAQWFSIEKRVTDCRDPKDNMFLDLILACSADYLITGDSDLLVLDPYGKTRILTLREWKRLRAPSER
jgi:putative PIN family toxin of toxin-antitoxin system